MLYEQMSRNWIGERKREKRREEKVVHRPKCAYQADSIPEPQFMGYLFIRIR